jgi:hypothetical protein
MGKKQKRRPRRVFLEGFDSYNEEYAAWKLTTIVKRLVGIFEVSQATFAGPPEHLPAAVGLEGYSLVQYAAQYDNSIPASPEEPISGAGCTMALRDPYGKIVPVVFVRADVCAVDRHGEMAENRHPQFDDLVRLAVLLHELGHADDIAKGVNFNHAALEIDLPAAEAYAHAFVCRQARRNYYPLLLNLYLENVERMARSGREVDRVGAELFLQATNISALRAWIAKRQTPAGLTQLLERCGRAEEIIRMYSD